MNNRNNNNNYTIKRDDLFYDDFLKYIENYDPYKVLGCVKEDDIGYIKKRFKKLYNRAKSQEIVDREELLRLEKAFKILNTKEYRKLYDSHASNSSTLPSLVSGMGYKNQSDLKKSILYPICSILNFGLNTVLIRVQANPMIVAPKAVALDIFRKSGFGGFYRGALFSVFVIPLESARYFITQKLLRLSSSTSKLQYNQTLIDYTHDIVRIICLYPITIAFDYVLLSPLQMKTIDILKKTLNYKTLYHGFFYYVGLSIFSKILRDIVNKIGLSIYKAHQRNPKNLSLYYLEIAYNNHVTKSIIQTLLCCPIHCIRAQYPLSVVNYIYSGLKLTPLTSSPLEIAKQIYNSHNGFGKFYNGFGLMIISRLFTKIAMHPVNSIHQTELIFE